MYVYIVIAQLNPVSVQLFSAFRQGKSYVHLDSHFLAEAARRGRAVAKVFLEPTDCGQSVGFPLLWPAIGFRRVNFSLCKPT